MKLLALAQRLWRALRWPVIVLAILFAGLVIARIPAVTEQERTALVVAEIQSQRLTSEHVDGKHLPPPPDPSKADATVEGVDANMNGIRDDVELAIFEKYPNNLQLRAAELQYAMALQTYLTKVFNTETWKAAAIQKSRAYACISETYPRTNLETYLQVTKQRSDEVEMLVLNTDVRRHELKAVDEFTTSYSLPSETLCDVK